MSSNGGEGVFCKSSVTRFWGGEGAPGGNLEQKARPDRARGGGGDLPAGEQRLGKRKATVSIVGRGRVPFSVWEEGSLFIVRND